MLTWLLTNTAMAAALALGTWLMTRRGRLAPGVAHALWLVVLVRLVSPVGLVWPVAIGPSSPAAPAEFALPAPELVAGLGASGPSAAWGGQPPSAFDWRAWVGPAVLGVWLAGALTVVGGRTRSVLRFRRALALAEALPESVRRAAEREAQRLGVRLPNAVQLPGLSGPFVWCWGRPTLVWPERLEQRLSSEATAGVLAHELAHLKRRDHWVRRATVVLGVVFWFHPLFWWARREIDRAAELACDQYAACRGAHARRAYAEALLEVSRAPSSPTLAVAMAAGGRGDLERRLTLVMRPPSTPGRFSVRRVVLAAGLLAVPGWVLAAPDRAAAIERPSDPDAPRVSLESPSDPDRGERVASALRGLVPESSGCTILYESGRVVVRGDAESAAVLDAWVKLALRRN